MESAAVVTIGACDSDALSEALAGPGLDRDVVVYRLVMWALVVD